MSPNSCNYEVKGQGTSADKFLIKRTRNDQSSNSTKMRSYKVVFILVALVLAWCTCAQDSGEVTTNDCQKCCEDSNCIRPNCACESNCANNCNQGCYSSCRGCSRPCSSKQVEVPRPIAHIQESIPLTHHNNVSNNVTNNVTTIFEMTSVVHNNNTVHIPVTYNVQSENKVHIIPPSQPSISIKISSTSSEKVSGFEEIKEITTTTTRKPTTTTRTPTTTPEIIEIITHTPNIRNESCCLIVPPPQCTYHQNKLYCQQTPRKVCGQACLTPLVVQHPVINYQPPPQLPSTPILPLPSLPQQPPTPLFPLPPPPPPATPLLPLHIPTPPQPPQSTPCDSVHNIPPQSALPPFYQPPPPQPTPCNNYVQPPPQPTCPTSTWNGVQLPICRTIQETQQFQGTNTQFILDQFNAKETYRQNIACTRSPQFPWRQCNRQNVQDCSGCISCNTGYNPSRCVYSPQCSPSCQYLMADLNLTGRIKNSLKCDYQNAGLRCV